MVYFILDTNIWLYLANGLDIREQKHHPSHHFKLLEALIDMSENGSITVLVNDIIIEEWKRNKDHAFINIKKLKNQLAEQKLQLDHVKKVGGEEVDSEIIKISKVIEEKFTIQTMLNEEHITEVEKFILTKCKKIPISDTLKIKVFDLSISKQVPFHNKKNNIADASILLSAGEYLNDLLHEEDVSAIFITNNTDDFTDNKNKEDFHPDLLKLLPQDGIKFQRYLPAAIKHSEVIIKEMEEFYRKQAYYDSISFACKSMFCEGKDDFTRFGYLDGNMEVVRESDSMNINQIDLFTNEVKLKAKATIAKYGDCVFCYSTHLECPICDELIVDPDFDENFICKECRTLFSFSTINEQSGLMILQILDITDVN